MSSKMVLVPASMLLDRETIGAINFHCGDGGDNFGEHSDGLLWVGTVTDDDGKEVYGLHLATAEYPEEGSTTLVEFAAPVVERQPFAWMYLERSEDGYEYQPLFSRKKWIVLPDGFYEESPLYTAPPELAELQATIVQLTDQNTRLKSGIDDDMAEVERLQALYDKEFRKVRQLKLEIERMKTGIEVISAKLELDDFCLSVDLRELAK
jgi:hypothetical protein